MKEMPNIGEDLKEILWPLYFDERNGGITPAKIGRLAKEIEKLIASRIKKVEHSWLEAKREYHRLRGRERHAKGLCKDCNTVLTGKSKWRCDKCLIKLRGYVKKYNLKNKNE